MTVLLWIARLIVLLLVIRLVLRLITRARSAPRAQAFRRQTAGERSGGALVRDPQCGTYVPQSRAIAVGSGDRALYFCSSRCRDEHAAAGDAASRATTYVK